MDELGPLRVRMRFSFLKNHVSVKHPIVLPPDSRFRSMAVVAAHLRLLRYGVRDAMVELREKFWISIVRQLTTNIVYSCLVCRRYIARASAEISASLPSDRITECNQFKFIGIDLSGPLCNRDDASKRYIFLITCASMRVFHLEFVAIMTTEYFFMAFRRFVARRRTPSTMYSDSTSTFKRADNELKKLWKLCSSH